MFSLLCKPVVATPPRPAIVTTRVCRVVKISPIPQETDKYVLEILDAPPINISTSDTDPTRGARPSGSGEGTQ